MEQPTLNFCLYWLLGFTDWTIFTSESSACNRYILREHVSMRRGISPFSDIQKEPGRIPPEHWLFWLKFLKIFNYSKDILW
jgi:hypothetical protein